TEERAPPFRQELLCELLVVGTQGEPDLGRRIARLRERGEQLLVNDLAPAGRLDSHGHLGRGVQAVLEAGQIVERLAGETVGRALRDPFESNERAAERLPQVGDRRLVPLPVAPRDSPLHARRIIPRYRLATDGFGGPSGCGRRRR